MILDDILLSNDDKEEEKQASFFEADAYINQMKEAKMIKQQTILQRKESYADQERMPSG